MGGKSTSTTMVIAWFKICQLMLVVLDLVTDSGTIMVAPTCRHTFYCVIIQRDHVESGVASYIGHAIGAFRFSGQWQAELPSNP